MKIVQINHFSYKAAGHIMLNIHRYLTAKGVDSYVVWGRGRKAENDREYYMGDTVGVRLHGVYTRLTDRTGFASKAATKRLLEWLDTIRPDIIHLHCIHGYYINIQMLFEYIKANRIPVVWTQHDCWSFTGHCAYFDSVGCNKWIDGCHHCEQLKTYPASLWDASKENWHEKKSIFGGVDMTLVTPCHWLRELIQKSFLKQYPVSVIHNGINLEVFKPQQSNFREKYGIGDKVVILGVASEWTERKGLKDLLLLDDMINHETHQIVIVGLKRKQIKELPASIIGITRTENVQQLVEIYSASDFFFNPTHEDNFPTTNLEALACGTPVITYKTGGSPESISGDACGFVTAKGNISAVYDYIIRNSANGHANYTLLDQSMFSLDAMIHKYGELYYEKSNQNIYGSAQKSN